MTGSSEMKGRGLCDFFFAVVFLEREGNTPRTRIQIARILRRWNRSLRRLSGGDG